jgi:O-antigen/teichoic acid export membrane protein
MNACAPVSVAPNADNEQRDCVSSFRRSLGLSFAERYSSLAITIATTVVLARLLTPVETGIYSVAAGIINIAQILREFGVGSYILQEADLTQKRLGTALGISLLFGAGMAAIFLFAAGPIASFYGEPRLYSIVLVMSLNFILVGFASIGFARLRRDMKFEAILRLGILSTLAHSATSIVLSAAGFGAMGLVWASIAAIVVSLIGNYYYYPRDLLLVPSLREWRRIADYSAFATGGYILTEVNERTPDLVVGRILGFASAGLYSRANGFISLFERALMQAIAPVLLSKLASLNRDKQDLKAPFLTSLGYTTVVAWPLLGMMSILSFPIVQIVFGSQWLGAVTAAQILCIAAGFKVLGRPSLALFSAVGAARRLLAVQAIAVPIEIVAVVVGSFYSIETAAIGSVFGSFALAVLSLHNVKSVIRSTWQDFFGTILKGIVISVTSLAAPVLIFIFYPITASDMWLPTAVVAASGTVSWFISIVVMRHPLGAEIRLLFNTLRKRPFAQNDRGEVAREIKEHP